MRKYVATYGQERQPFSHQRHSDRRKTDVLNTLLLGKALLRLTVPGQGDPHRTKPAAPEPRNQKRRLRA